MVMINKNNLVLTVAIPTYNRAEFLKRTLEVLRGQYNEAMEILVSDNNSTDDTFQLVSMFQQSMPYLRYHRNACNLGFDANIVKLYELAMTRYIWLLGDDDLVEDRAIENILQALSKYSPTVALFRHSYVDDKGARSIHPPWLNEDRIIGKFEKSNDYLIFLSTVFLSALVIQKSPKVQSADLIQYQGSAMIHMTISLLLLSKDWRLCVLTPVIVRHHQGRIYNQDLILHFITGGIRAVSAVSMPESRFDMAIYKRLVLSEGCRGCGRIILSSKIGRSDVKFPVHISHLRELYDMFGILSLPAIAYLSLCILMPAPAAKLLHSLKSMWNSLIISPKQ